ncbi:PEP-CTERM sorting domain-containing protein [Trichormus sp. NMC-1]|uniref:PEP-CTERM sorting domain-containing protein n=1 Tax=Trichormus sp. NMC-1 TaxID=1853259 RepID=UPI0008DBF5D5|nr:PEP-CTERM sorting domain-containing protein [Trichormus sp. NMC-1]
MKLASIATALAAVTGITIAAIAMPASATTTNFGFGNIESGDTVGDAFASGLSFNFTNNNDGTVLFKFLNNTSGQNAIKQFAFSVDPTVSGLLSGMQLNVGNVGNVNFAANTQNLSQSNKISGWDGTTFGGGTTGGNNKSVQVGEQLGVKFTGVYDNILAALNNGSLKVGLHVGSLPINGTGDGGSDSYVNLYTPPAPPPARVPEPASLVGLGLVASGMVMVRRRRTFAN